MPLLLGGQQNWGKDGEGLCAPRRPIAATDACDRGADDRVWGPTCPLVFACASIPPLVRRSLVVSAIGEEYQRLW